MWKGVNFNICERYLETRKGKREVKQRKIDKE
jgi:hypothetical protein